MSAPPCLDELGRAVTLGDEILPPKSATWIPLGELHWSPSVGWLGAPSATDAGWLISRCLSRPAPQPHDMRGRLVCVGDELRLGDTWHPVCRLMAVRGLWVTTAEFDLPPPMNLFTFPIALCETRAPQGSDSIPTDPLGPPIDRFGREVSPGDGIRLRKDLGWRTVGSLHRYPEGWWAYSVSDRNLSWPVGQSESRPPVPCDKNVSWSETARAWIALDPYTDPAPTHEPKEPS